MATSKKAAKKKSPSKAGTKNKTVQRKTKPTITQAPIRIIIEVVVRNETAPLTHAKSFTEITEQNMLVQDTAEGNNFSYSFERSNCTILKIVVERFEKDNPPDTGEFFTTVLDPNIPPKVRVMVVARQDFPGGNGRLTLKYKGKDVFSSPEEISFSGGMGGINKLVKLPS